MKLFVSRLLTELSGRDASVSGIFRNMAILASGTAGAQVIAFAATPAITRIYSPADFGVLSVFVVVLAFLSPFVTLRYSAAIPLPRHAFAAVNLLVLCLVLSTVLALVVGLGAFFLGGLIFEQLSAPILADYWWLVPIALVAIGFYETLSSMATREKQFKVLAKTQITQALFGSGTKIALGLLSFGPIGLLVGQVVSQGAGISSLAARTARVLKSGLKRTRANTVIFLARRFYDFPRFQIPSRFLLVFISKAPLLAVAIYFSTETVGQLALAFMTIAIPAQLIIRTASQAFLADIAKIGKKNTNLIYEISKKISQKMFFAGMIPSLALIFWAPELFAFVFGAVWAEAGGFATILAILLWVRFIVSPLVGSMTVLEKQNIIFRMNIMTAILTAIVFSSPLVFEMSAISLVWAYVITISLQSFFYHWIILRTIRTYAGEVAK